MYRGIKSMTVRVAAVRKQVNEKDTVKAQYYEVNFRV
jgi:hypothetical protein